MDLFKRKKKAERQEWSPHWTFAILQKLWMAAFAAFKIALGAVATVLIIVVICLLVFAGTLGDYLEQDVLPMSELVLENFSEDQASSMYYLDENGNIQLLQNLYTTTNRRWASLDEIPQDLINATIAIEDKRFYEHQGVDWFTTIKACVGMFIGGSDGGGSTITQQLVKNVTQENSVTVQRKVLEWFRAAALEKKYDKDRILEEYLNRIYLGQMCYGVKSAASVYFGKELEMLTAAECASLIAITNNPSLYDPYGREFEFKYGTLEAAVMTGKERNRLRQLETLNQMFLQGMLTEEEYEAAKNQEMVFKSGIDDMDRMTQCTNEECGYRHIASSFAQENGSFACPVCGTAVDVITNASQSVYSYFVDTVYEDVATALAAKDGITDMTDEVMELYKLKISRGGYHIYTTIDMKVQNQIDKIYQNLDEIPTTRSGQQLESAIVVIDNETGYIVGLAGGVGEKTVHDGLNIAVDSKLQTGSSIKPLTVYAPAFESGLLSPISVVKDMPLNYNPKPFPLNDSRTYRYRRTIYNALVNSINASCVDVLDTIGIKYGYNFAKEKFGLTSLVDSYTRADGYTMSDKDYAPLALGAQTFGVTVREMAQAFAVFGSEGVWREGLTFTKVFDSQGNLVLDMEQESRKILSTKTVDYINYCLQNAVSVGTGTAAKISGQYVAGKTGTTGDNKDRWFCGYTTHYTAAVWCGYKVPEEIILTGNKTNPAARLFKKVMEPLHQGLKKEALFNTSKMRTVKICLDSGLLATDACEVDVRTADYNRVHEARAYREDFPEEKCDKHVLMEYCTDGVANEYCKLFAEAGQCEIKQKSLVKITEAEIEEIKKAEDFKLDATYLRDDYVYLVNQKDKPVQWKGFDGKLNKGSDLNYKTCTVHTKEAWEQYQASLVPETTPPAEEPPVDNGISPVNDVPAA